MPVSEDLKQTKAMEERKRQEQAGQVLMQERQLPVNISDMKSFAWGRFTWRDVLVSGLCIMIPALLMLPLSAILPIWIVLIIAIILALPLLYFANRHLFTGDLPIEEQIRIAMANKGNSDLLVWDKTKRDGRYVETATQNFVPEIEFTEDNYVLLPHGGGFSVLQVTCDDTMMAKNTEQLAIYQRFNTVLNSLVTDTDTIPIQILLKSSPIDIESYIEIATQNMYRIQQEPPEKYRPLLEARANDYLALLGAMDSKAQFYYDYYVVITYREDAEGVGDDSMNTASVRRQRMKEKVNPLQKRQETLAGMDFEIGEDRKKKIKEATREKKFSRRRVLETLKKRTQVVMGRLKQCGTTYTDVSARVLTREEISKLFFQCYNSQDKEIIDTVVSESLYPKVTMTSSDVYRDFPDLFKRPEKKRGDKASAMQRAGALGRRR